MATVRVSAAAGDGPTEEWGRDLTHGCRRRSSAEGPGHFQSVGPGPDAALPPKRRRNQARPIVTG